MSREFPIFSFKSSFALCLILGMLNILSFAPFHVWPIQILSLALVSVLAWRLPTTTFKKQFVLGWAYSFAWLFGGVSWLLVALTKYGGLSYWLAVPALALLAGYLAIYAGIAFAAWGAIARRWQLSASIALVALFPALWGVSEWLRGTVLTGFPWLASGYAHTASPLSGFAPVLGVYGLGWLSALVSGLLALVFLVNANWKRNATFIVLIFLAGAGLHQYEWTQKVGQPITVRLLQGNVDQDIKFDENHVVDSLILYRDLVTKAPADLIVTPETALPLLTSQLPADYLTSFKQFAQATNSHIIVGAGVDDGGNRYSNSVLGFSPQQAAQTYRYDKHHLVPFGEFVPYGFQWFVRLLHIPLGDFSTAGIQQAPFQVRDQWVMPNICYEDLFGEEIAAQLSFQHKTANGAASILLNASNIAWYGDSIAIPQHLQISQMRALEMGRPMIRSTNTGATAVIQANGRIDNQLMPLTRDTLQTQVQGRFGLTPYANYGNGGIAFIFLIAFIVTFKGRKQVKRAT